MNAFSMGSQPPATAQAAEQGLAAARAGDDIPALVTALLAQGEVDLASGETAQALTHFQEALSLAQQQQLVNLTMQCWGAMGRALYHYRNYQGAHTALQRALQQALQQRNIPLALDALLHIGLVEADAGDVGHATVTLEHAVAQTTAHQDLARLAIAANRLGQLLVVSDPAKAATYFGQALASATQVNKPQAEMQARLGLGRAYTLQGEHTPAAGEFAQALILAEAFGEPNVYATVLGEVMRAQLAAGQNDAALAGSEEVLARVAQSGAAQTEATLLLQVGTVWVEQGDYGRALNYLPRATSLLQHQEDGPMLVNLQSAIGTAHFQLGDFDAAYAAYCEALALAEHLEIIEARAVLHGRLSAILTERQEAAAALEQAELGVALADGLQMAALQGELTMVLAFALYDLDRREEAIAHAQRAHAMLVALKNTQLAQQVELILAEWHVNAQAA